MEVEVVAHFIKIDRARRSILGAEVLRCDTLVIVEALLQLQDLVLKLVDLILQLVIFANSGIIQIISSQLILPFLLLFLKSLYCSIFSLRGF